jgi:hypothetical protein
MIRNHNYSFCASLTNRYASDQSLQSDNIIDEIYILIIDYCNKPNNSHTKEESRRVTIS